MINLYDDQIELIEQIREELRNGNRAVLAVASTGFGKTVASAYMAKQAAERGKRVWFLCHLKNLLMQTSKAFWSLHIEHGLIAAGKRNSPLPVQVGTIGTVVRRLDDLQAPDLLIVDECMTGDTIVITPDGEQRLDQTSAGDIVMCYDDGSAVFRRVSAAWCSGVRQIYEVKSSCGKTIRCTDNHKIKTQRGWVRTDELKTGDRLFIANAGAEQGFTKTVRAEKGDLFSAIKLGEGVASSGKKNESNCSEDARTVRAAVEAKLQAGTLKPWMISSDTRGIEHSINILPGTSIANQVGIMCLQKISSRLYTAPFLVIRALGIRMKKALRRACTLLMESPRKNGRATRPRTCTECRWLSGSAKTKGMATPALSAHRGAANSSGMCMQSLGAKAASASLASGSIRLEQSGYAGGCVMTAASPEMDSPCTQKASLTASRSLSVSGFQEIMEKSRFSKTEATNTFTSTLPRWIRSTRRSRPTYQGRCAISFSTVASVRKLDVQEPVYDITVPSTGNFFANGVLVHNCHLAMAATWVRVIDWAKANGSIIIGNSATPERLDGKGLGYLFDSMTEARPMRWLIDRGRLSDYVIYSTAEPLDTSGLRTRAGDFATDQAEELMNKPKLIGDAASHWKRYANGLRTIAYCVTIKHSKATAAQFNAAGIPAIHVDGETPEVGLKEAIQGFADGRYLVLCNVQLMTTGFDLSAQVNRDVPIEACIIMRPTRSVALYMQMVGRALRRKPRPAVILDHAGCVLRHGLPDDQREWSLEGRKKGSRRSSDDEPDVNVTQCKQCYAIFRTGPNLCPSCGAEVEVKVQREIEVADGELVKVDVEAFRKQQRMEQGKARGLRELVGLGLRRGMKNPSAWAANVFAARSGRKAGAVDYKEAREIMMEIAQ